MGYETLGLTTSMVSTCAVAAIVVLEVRTGRVPSPTAIACGVINLAMFLSWAIWFTPSWVRIAAFAYADRLLAACETLKSGNKSMPKVHFLNVCEGDCTVIEHNSGHVTVIDVCNAGPEDALLEKHSPFLQRPRSAPLGITTRRSIQ